MARYDRNIQIKRRKLSQSDSKGIKPVQSAPSTQRDAGAQNWAPDYHSPKFEPSVTAQPISRSQISNHQITRAVSERNIIRIPSEYHPRYCSRAAGTDIRTCAHASDYP